MSTFFSLAKKLKPLYMILFIGYVFVHISSNALWGNQNYVGIIETDGVGYYSYLPAVFIYQDLSFDFLDTVSDHFAQGAKQQIQAYSGNYKTNKYFIGTSILLAPFFFIAHAITIWTGGLADGYSMYYQIIMSIAGIFYTLLGLYFMSRILSLYRIPFLLTNFILLTLAFGTSLLVYAVFEPTMSHVYSFYLINHVLYLFLQQKDNFSPSRNLIIAILLALIVLVRPINIIVVLSLCWIFDNTDELVNYLKKTWSNLIYVAAAVFLFFSIVAIQPLWYYISTDNPFLYSYSKEGFNWSRPEFINYLFSFKKGLFIYTPICFIGMLAGLYLYRKTRYLLCSWFLFLIVVVYVLCSWWCWWYGGSFGQRSMIEFYFIFFIPLALLLNELKAKKQTTLIILASICVVVCQIQIYQYRYYYIHYTDMNWEKYKKVFLRVDYILKEIPAGDVYKESN